MKRAVFCLGLLFGCALSDPVVEGPLGRITGKIQRFLDVDVESFLGLPYAKPPVGDLRFALPEPFGSVGDLQATDYGAPCPQPDYGLFETPGWRFEEDCLFLNVLRKKGTSKNDKKAVVAIIPGGAYILGASSDSFQNAAPLAGLGDVILVSINYRLGVLGFADMKDLAPGNLGLRDQRLALQWIQDHISDFGGDPERVTVVGDSAGSMSLAAQIITPIDDRNLFRAAVLDAGVVAANGFFEDTESSLARVTKIAQHFACPVGSKEMLECLRNVKVEDLLPVSFNFTGNNPLQFFVATEDGDFIPRNVEKYVEQNSAKIRRLPIIIGYAKDEGTQFVQPIFSSAEIDFSAIKTNEETLELIQKVSTSYNQPLDLTAESIKHLVRELYVDAHSGNPFRAVAELQADGIFKCPINEFVRSYSRFNDEVYVYQFERLLRGTYKNYPNIETIGAFHGSPYLHFSGVLFLGNTTVHPADQEFSLETIDMISAFARNNGRPTFRGVEWPRFSESEEILILDESPSTRKGLSSERRCREVFSRDRHLHGAKSEL